ncbi:iron chaperone [Fulvivirga sedimenti]|uniref:DUF1801 domain-containing protein n=1 Tax=Fulvivirga sedimenti TaxID=2879465 RepID=A0A9X1HXC9_9BACT|nr:DUF1801 domain-containing protein [Fulvivirga sedimenti]MCA6078194.1 DUF1801 domain-containing protein [Fulvivirga sedimenti]
MSQRRKHATVDEYIANFPPDIQSKLEHMRFCIREACPEAFECISYGMPTYKLSRALVHFAGYQHHIGFYPTPSAISEFKNDLREFHTSKGAVQFPLENDIPCSLVQRIVRFRVKELNG